jgi:tRNA dimethylallyltransferase
VNELPVIAIFGATATGKTAVATEVARMLRTRGLESEAVSADAYAVYREIPIITGAPTREEQDLLTHHCVGIRSVTDEFSVGEFKGHAHAAIDQVRAAGKVAIVVGGTGLYLRAALSDLALRPAVAPQLRAELESRLELEGPEVLHAELTDTEPEVAARLTVSDSRRILRALELSRSGLPPHKSLTALWDQPARHPTIALGLVREREERRRLITERIERMIDLGAAAEVTAAWKIGPSRTAAAAIGMRELRTGDVESMRNRTQQFAKRQGTWLRRLEDTEIVTLSGADLTAPVERILHLFDSRAA